MLFFTAYAMRPALITGAFSLRLAEDEIVDVVLVRIYILLISSRR